MNKETYTTTYDMQIVETSSEKDSLVKEGWKFTGLFDGRAFILIKEVKLDE